MPLKIGIIVAGALIIIDCVLEILMLYFITQNDYFDKIYPMVYFLILLPLFAAAGLFIYYYATKDSPFARSNLPIALILAVISSFLLFFWILIYILAIYPRDQVLVGKFDKETEFNLEDNDGAKQGKYTKQPKGTYLFTHSLLPVIMGIAYLVFFFITRDWADRHRG